VKDRVNGQKKVFIKKPTRLFTVSLRCILSLTVVKNNNDFPFFLSFLSFHSAGFCNGFQEPKGASS